MGNYPVSRPNPDRPYVSGPKFGKTEREKVVARAVELESLGFNQYEIAERLGVTQNMVSKYLIKAREKYQVAVIENLHAQRERELALSFFLQKEALDAWERSKQDAEITVSEKQEEAAGDPRGNGGKARHKVQMTRKGQSGDPRFLQVIAQQSEARRKLLGLDAPTKSLNLTGVKIEQTSELLVRMKEYAGVLGFDPSEAESLIALDDGLDESLDSDGPDPEAGVVLDVEPA